MERGKSKPTLGDSASDFMAEWKASRPEVLVAAADPGRFQRSIRGDPTAKETFRSWKRGGGEVKVTKGTSIGYEKRQKKSAVSPHSRRPKPPAPVPRIVHPALPAVPQPGRASVAKLPVREHLREASADVRKLRIAAAMSRPRSAAGLAPVAEARDGRLAILGLDFGTAFTKAVVRWSGRHYAIDWSHAVEGDDHHLLASVFSEGPDGRCVLGAQEAAGWSIREGIKLKLLSSAVAESDEHLSEAVIFIALAFRYVDGWLRQTNREVEKGMRWRLHVGLPTRSWDSDATAEAFKTVAQAARVLAFMPKPVTRVAALEALRMTDQVDRPAVDVFPEFACQLYSYLLSPERGDDLHALVDIGAGTLDVAYFNVFMKEDEAVLPIFASEVDRLGAHYLIAALAGSEGCHAWSDGESSLSDEEVGRKLVCSPSEVCSRRSLYLSSVAEVFNLATNAARKTYPTSPAFQRDENVRLFLCGGGSRIPALQKRFELIAKEAATRLGIKFQVSDLVRPRDIVGKLESGFDRLSVAYGLSQNAANIGSVMRSATLMPLAPQGRIDHKDRDEDR